MPSGLSTDNSLSLRLRRPQVIHTGALARYWPPTKLGLALVGIAIAAFVVGPMFSAQLGAIDDHEIYRLAGMPWSEIVLPRLFEENRVRPAWWLLYGTEITVWGGAGMYLDRLVLLLVTLAAAFAIGLRFVSPVLAAIGASLIVAGPQADGFYRLGAQEAWVVPLLLVGAWAVLRGSAWGVALLVLAAFTKEAAWPFATAGMLLAWQHVDRRAVMAGAVALAVDALLIVLVLAGGRDLYALPRTPVTIAGAVWWLAVPLALAGALAAVAILRGWRPRWLSVAALLVLAEAVIYAGQPAYRYLLPSMLVGAAVSVAAAHFLRWRLLVPILVVAAAAGILEAHRGAEYRRDQSVAWQEQLAAIRAGAPMPTDLTVEEEYSLGVYLGTAPRP